MGRRDHADFGYERHQPDPAPDFDTYERGAAAAHEAFCEGVEDTEGVITTHDPQTAPFQVPAGYGAVLSDEMDYNPVVGPGTKPRRY